MPSIEDKSAEGQSGSRKIEDEDEDEMKRQKVSPRNLAGLFGEQMLNYNVLNLMKRYARQRGI